MSGAAAAPAPPVGVAGHGPPPASRLWFWLPIAPLVAADLWTKAAAFRFLDLHYPSARAHAQHLVWDGLVRFELVRWHNTGTIWGLFQGYNLPLVILRCIAVVLILHFVLRHVHRSRLLLLVLGGILAGALGNLYDNLTEANGGVRDFLYFTFFPGTGWQYGFPAFNVADACISVGVISLVVSILFAGRWASPPVRGGPRTRVACPP